MPKAAKATAKAKPGLVEDVQRLVQAREDYYEMAAYFVETHSALVAVIEDGKRVVREENRQERMTKADQLRMAKEAQSLRAY